MNYPKNYLFNIKPDLLTEWNFEKNIISPELIGVASNKIYWWKCKNGHEWQHSPNGRAFRNNNCRKCNSLEFNHPELLKEWHYEKNVISPIDISRGSGKKVWWKCKNNHEWSAAIHKRTGINRRNCPYCANKKIDINNSLLKTHPELCKEWNFKKNKYSPKNYTFGSSKFVWWKCNKEHEWKATIHNRTKKSGCPYCIKSKGEIKIKELLDKNQIIYQEQYSLPECKYKRVLKFDFAVWINKQLKLIEYNGEQHYKTIYYKHKNKSNLKDQQIKDNIKINYCAINDIPLIIIKYTFYDNIETILVENNII